MEIKTYKELKSYVIDELSDKFPDMPSWQMDRVASFVWEHGHADCEFDAWLEDAIYMFEKPNYNY